MKKFLINSINRTDTALIFLYTLFTVKRIVSLDYVSEDFMPDGDNTGLNGGQGPSVKLGVGIIQNFLICGNCIIKFFLLLENLEGYGLLITLLIHSIRASLPFIVFSFVWLCVFCVFYRTIGLELEDKHSAIYDKCMNDSNKVFIHPFFQYFLYGFENMIGNMGDIKSGLVFW